MWTPQQHRPRFIALPAHIQVSHRLARIQKFQDSVFDLETRYTAWGHC
jgi:hypothetical protein